MFHLYCRSSLSLLDRKTYQMLNHGGAGRLLHIQGHGPLPRHGGGKRLGTWAVAASGLALEVSRHEVARFDLARMYASKISSSAASSVAIPSIRLLASALRTCP